MVFLQQLSNGVIIGFVYSLMAIGLSLIFGVMKLVNFAHGELYMLGAYVTYFACHMLNLPPVISLFISMIIVFGVGMIIESTFISHMRKEHFNLEHTILLTFAISIFLQNLALIVWGPTYKRNPPILKGVINMGLVVQSKQRLLVVGIAIMIIIIVTFILKKTKIGWAIRATSQLPETAEIMGININYIYMITFGIGSSLASVAGSLIAPIFYIYPTMGVVPVMKAFVVIILGGLGSVEGAIIGGIVIGITETLTSAYISSQYETAVAFIIMIILLIFKPSGLLSIKQKNMR
jgi:branched-chain amino acid transport system permease protein